MTTETPEIVARCSFCPKDSTVTECVVTSDGAAICAECIEVAMALVLERRINLRDKGATHDN